MAFGLVFVELVPDVPADRVQIETDLECSLAARVDWREIPIIVVTAKQLSAGERERLSRQAQKVMEKATTTRVDIAAAIGAAVRRRPARVAAAQS